MTPLPQNPTVVVLIGTDDTVKGFTTNVDRDLNLQVTRSERIFAELSQGQPFDSRVPAQPPQVLAMRKNS